MTKVQVGKIVSTHGIKGEVKVLSHFPYKEKAFRVGNKVTFSTGSTFVISSYRVHQKYDLLTFEGIHNINEILPFIPCSISTSKEEMALSNREYLDEELLGFSVYFRNKKIGEIMEIFLASPKNKIIRIKGDKEILLPFQDHFVESIDLKNRRVVVFLEEGMLYED